MDLMRMSLKTLRNSLDKTQVLLFIDLTQKDCLMGHPISCKQLVHLLDDQLLISLRLMKLNQLTSTCIRLSKISMTKRLISKNEILKFQIFITCQMELLESKKHHQRNFHTMFKSMMSDTINTIETMESQSSQSKILTLTFLLSSCPQLKAKLQQLI